MMWLMLMLTCAYAWHPVGPANLPGDGSYEGPAIHEPPPVMYKRPDIYDRPQAGDPGLPVN